MLQACRRRRALRAALGLAFMLALGFAADAVVLVTATGRARCGDRSRRGREGPANGLGPEQAKIHRYSHRAASRRPGKAIPGCRERRSSSLEQRGTAGRIGSVVAGDDRHHPGLAVCGGIIAAGRRFLPQGAGVGMQVVGRVSLSPKHTVYLLRVGRRVLLVGAGPQGSPSLISELDDLAEIEPDPPRGDQP